MKKYLLTLVLLIASMSAIAQVKKESVNDNVFDRESVDSDQQIEILIESTDSGSPSPITTESKEHKPYITVEQMPMFPGGEGKMMEFIANNLIYPDSARQERLQGRIVIRFIVEVDGSLSNIKAIRSFDKACEEEAVRIVELMPRWNPGKQNGKEVRVYYTIPVMFRIEE